MTASARTALINIGTRRQGSTLSAADRTALDELQSLGLVGKGGGLTRKGSIKREALYDALLEERFS